jgi:hypothetical protein
MGFYSYIFKVMTIMTCHPTKELNEKIAVYWRVTALYLLLVLYKADDWLIESGKSSQSV